MIIFWILYVIDSIFTLVTLYFFFLGLADGSISSFNILYWLGILAVLAAVLGGSWRLKSKGHLKRAYLVLLVLAIPALFFAGYLMLAIFSDVRWN